MARFNDQNGEAARDTLEAISTAAEKIDNAITGAMGHGVFSFRTAIKNAKEIERQAQELIRVLHEIERAEAE